MDFACSASLPSLTTGSWRTQLAPDLSNLDDDPKTTKPSSTPALPSATLVRYRVAVKLVDRLLARSAQFDVSVTVRTHLLPVVVLSRDDVDERLLVPALQCGRATRGADAIVALRGDVALAVRTQSPSAATRLCANATDFDAQRCFAAAAAAHYVDNDGLERYLHFSAMRRTPSNNASTMTTTTTTTMFEPTFDAVTQSLCTLRHARVDGILRVCGTLQ